VAGPDRGAVADLPSQFGPWETVASRFYRWRRQAPADPDQPGDRERDRDALGRSRGGYSTQLHLRVEGRGRPMVILATAGQRHEALLQPVNRLKGWRRVATRYEKREVNYLAMVTIAAIVLLWLE
jgi:hypothetical protein